MKAGLSMPEHDEKRLKEWLDRIDDDLNVIRNTIDGKFVPNAVAFHAQQASEKMLKLVLISEGINPPYIHSLKRLMDLLRRDFPLRDAMASILQFENMHLDSRYPSENYQWSPPNVSESKLWVLQLQTLRDLIAAHIFKKDTP